MSCQVAELLGPRQLVFRKETLPVKNLPSGHLLARTICSAISVGTELAAWQGLPPLRPGKVYPRLVGYCNVAKVLATGPDTVAAKPGDRILTFQSHRSAFVCPEREILLKLASGDGPARASTTYLFHLGYNALLKGSFTPGHQVAVVGLGTVGTGTVATAASLGGRVGAFSDQPEPLTLAGELGARFKQFKSDPAAAARYREFTGGGADLVISTSSRWADWKLALQLARREGTICVLGFPGRGEPAPDFNPLDSQFFYDQQLKLIACGMSPEGDPPLHEVRFTVKRNCAFLRECMEDGRLPADRLIGGESAWQDLAGVYDQLSSRSRGSLTRVLKWD